MYFTSVQDGAGESLKGCDTVQGSSDRLCWENQRESTTESTTQ